MTPRRALRRGGGRQAEDPEDAPSAEKGAGRARAGVDTLATVLRLWQFGSSLFAYLSFAGLYSYISHYRLGETGRMAGVRQLALFSVVYSTLVLICFHVFGRSKSAGCLSSASRMVALATVPGDLLMMGVAIAQITVLSIAGLPADCHGLTRDNYFAGDLARQPRDGFTSIRFGAGTQDSRGELDFLCHVPRSVYGLCVVAIFMYTLSMLLTVFQLQREGKLIDPEEGSYPGYVEEAIPSVPFQRQTPLPSAGRNEAPMQTRPQMAQVSMPGSSRQQPPPLVTALPAGTARDGEPKYANMPAEVLSSPRGRLSQETTSSIDPDIYLVTDGFRPSGEPPALYQPAVEPIRLVVR